MASKKKPPREWTAVGAARAAREARIATVEFFREAPIARDWQAQKLLKSYELKVAHLGEHHAEDAALSLLTGMGYGESWNPGTWMNAAEQIVVDEAQNMASADLYILSPQMCDVVIAAAQTLTWDDLSLLAEADLPSPSGLVVLPHPVLVAAVNGDMGDNRAYLWHTPVQMPTRDPATRGWVHVPAVRISRYYDRYGPVRPDSFLDFADRARAQGHPLPPLLLDVLRCIAFETTVTEQDLRELAEVAAVAQHRGQRARDHYRKAGVEEERVIGEYAPGTEVQDSDDSFTIRFLYAFWRLCEQRIATTSRVEVRHAARVTAERAGVSPEVRVVQLRPSDHEPDGATTAGGRYWHHRWVVRMHKVRQWYPTEQRHKVIYRGPYLKGPHDKPLLGGETVRGLVR